MGTNVLITQYAIDQCCTLFYKAPVTGFSVPLKNRRCNVPACSPPSPGLFTFTAGARCRRFWSIHSKSFEF